jgi:hypothetical protein
MGILSKLALVRLVAVFGAGGVVAACSSGGEEKSSSTEERLAATCPVSAVDAAPAAGVVATAPTASWQGGIGYAGQYADTAFFGQDGDRWLVVGTKGGVVRFTASYKSAADGSLAVTLSQVGSATSNFAVAANGTATGSGNIAALDEVGAAAQNASTCGINVDCAKLQAKLWWERFHALHECLDPFEAPFLCAAGLALLAQTEKEYAAECTPRTGSCELCTGKPGGQGGLSCNNNCNNCAAATGVSAACLKNYCNNGGWDGSWPPKCASAAPATSATATATAKPL